MRPRSQLLSSIYCLLASLALAGEVHAQGVIGKTDLGKSQNTSEDLMNSLIVNNRPKVGKGEKKEEVDPKKLTSKKSNDTTFSGSLNDIGLDWTAEKMGKPHNGGEADSKAAKQSDADAKKADASRQTTNSQLQAPSSEAPTSQSKAKSTATAADEKAPDKEKAAAAKPDGDR